MKEDPRRERHLLAEIPSSATQGGIVDYFIEALGDNDGSWRRRAPQNKTLKISMLGPNGQPLIPAPARGRSRGSRREDESADLAVRARLRQRRRLGDGQGRGQRHGRGNPRRVRHVEAGPLRSRGRLLHLARVHAVGAAALSADFGGYVVLLGGPDGTCCGDGDVCSPGSYAFAGFGRATYFFGEGDFRTYVAGIAGLGRSATSRPSSRRPICGKSTTSLRRHRSVGARLRRRGRGHHVQPDPAFALTFGTNALLGFTQVHVPRRPERRRRVRVLADATSFRVPRAARARRTGGRRGGSSRTARRTAG